MFILNCAGSDQYIGLTFIREEELEGGGGGGGGIQRVHGKGGGRRGRYSAQSIDNHLNRE